VIEGWVVSKLVYCCIVIAGLVALLTALSLRAIARYDRD
jgi:hypothetical protein